MDDPEPAVLLLQLNAGDPISGQIRLMNGSDQPFYGWIELTRVLEDLRTGHLPPDTERSPQGIPR
jgi:hypothetical protein